MKIALALLIGLLSAGSEAGRLELSFEDRFEVKKVVMDDALLMDLLRPLPNFDIAELMLAKKGEGSKKGWSENLRLKLQSSGIIRL